MSYAYSWCKKYGLVHIDVTVGDKTNPKQGMEKEEEPQND